MLKFHEIFLTFFYCGKAKKAPGTVGSFASVIFWLFFTKFFFDQNISLETQNIFWGFFLISAFFYGCYASPIYAKKFDQIDHGSIVLDEVVGQILALQFTFFLLHENYFSEPELIAAHLFLCFIFFRFFDIVKPSFIGYCDRHFKNGFGVMFDDLVCGIVVAAIGGILILFFQT